MSSNSLTKANPLKVVFHHKKRLRICRLPKKEATFADLYIQLYAWKGCHAKSLTVSDADKQRRVEMEKMTLVNLNQFETQVEVQMERSTYHCRFAQPQVTFSDVVIDIGRQTEVMPRHLFRKKLFCCGCGRQVIRDEEEFQAIPAACCRVRSLKLSDRHVRDAGTQTAVPRRRGGGTKEAGRMQAAVRSLCETTTINSSDGLRAVKPSATSRNPAAYKTVTVAVSSLCHRAVEISTSSFKSSYSTVTVKATPLDYPDDSVPIRVRWMSDDLQAWHFVEPHATTGDLVTALQTLRPDDDPIGDISWDDRWLTAAANWQQQVLTTAWQLKAGDKLLLYRRPPSLQLSVWNPSGDSEGRKLRLTEEQSAGEALESAKKIFKRVKIADVVIFVQEFLHEDRRRSVRCYDSVDDKFRPVDVDSGRPADEDSKSCTVRRILSPTSVLPSSPLHQHIPLIVIKTDVQLMWMTADRQLEGASPFSLQEPTFVALMDGVRVGKQPAKFFWKSQEGTWVNASSGAIVPRENDIPDEGPRCFVMCLLRRADRPPLSRVPKGTYLRFFYRTGLQLTFEKDRLRAAEPVQPCDVERWILSDKVDKLSKDFTASARKG